MVVEVPNIAPAMVAELSALSARPKRGMFPFSSARPAFCVTATRVPDVSNKSTNKNAKITLSIESSKAAAKSNCIKVGKIEGGAAIIPWYSTKPKPSEIAVTDKILINTPLLKSRYNNAAIIKKLNIASNGPADVMSPSCTNVAGLATIMPEFLRAIRAKNAPMPVAMARFNTNGMAFIIHSLTLNKLNNKNIQPDINTAPNAASQVYPIPNTTPYVKKAFNPMPGAKANG